MKIKISFLSHLFAIFLLILIINFSLYGFSPIKNSNKNIYVAVNGSDLNSGTEIKPLLTINKAIEKVLPGDMIVLRGGEYLFSETLVIKKSGTSEKLIKLTAYKNESPILNFSGTVYSKDHILRQNGIILHADYWHINGIKIKNAKHAGLHVSGSKNIIENVVAFNNYVKGIIVTQAKYKNVILIPSDNLILNCDSYFNFNPVINGEDGDGFGAAEEIGEGNIFKKCRAWNNADDGFDMYKAKSPVLIEECYSFNNGYDLWGVGPNIFKGNGAGFKCPFHQASHVFKRSSAWNNSNQGFAIYCDEESDLKVIYQNNISLNNIGGNYSFHNLKIKHELTNNISYYNSEYKKNLSGQKYQDRISPNSIQKNNSWNLGIIVLEKDFISLNYYGYDININLGSNPENYRIDPNKIERNSNGTLPESLFLKLTKESNLIDKGINVGLPYKGNNPDLGPFESDY